MRVLVVTAVPVERDAVARAFTDGRRSSASPAPSCTAPVPSMSSRAARVRLPRPPRPPSPWPRGRARPVRAPGGTVRPGRLGRDRRRVRSPTPPSAPSSWPSAIVAADLGAETPDGFVPVTDLGFGRERSPAAARRWYGPWPRPPARCTGTVLTVSTVTGSAERAADLRTAHPRAVAEAMEGFGVAEAAARARRTGAGDPGRLEPRRPARPGRLAHRRRAGRAHRGVREAHRPYWRAGPPTMTDTADDHRRRPAHRVLALPERHLRLRRLGARPGPRRARPRRHLRRHRHHQRHGRARRARRAEGVVRGAAVGPGRVRAAALRRARWAAAAGRWC